MPWTLKDDERRPPLDFVKLFPVGQILEDVGPDDQAEAILRVDCRQLPQGVHRASFPA